VEQEINTHMQDKNDDITISPESEEENSGVLIKQLRQKIKELEEKNREYLTGWQRERADGVNLRKRLEEEKKEFSKFAKEDITTELMSVLDSFESAFKNKEAWEKVDKNWRVGVEYIHTQLVNVLGNHGVGVIDPLGEQFDPQRDEAIEMIEVKNEKDNHKILEVMKIHMMQ